jgi:hypothetical protein
MSVLRLLTAFSSALEAAQTREPLDIQPDELLQRLALRLAVVRARISSENSRRTHRTFICLKFSRMKVNVSS